jgi:hypothetical protein
VANHDRTNEPELNKEATMSQQPIPLPNVWHLATPITRVAPIPSFPMAEFRFAYATPDSVFAAELIVPANSAAGVALVLGVVVIVALVALSA